MITVVHGNDTATSRKFYIETREGLPSYVLIEEKRINYDLIFQSGEGDSLFDDSKNVFIENFFSAVKANSSEYKKIVDYINSSKSNIFIWESKELSKPQQFVFKKANLRVFNYPANLFAFLDSIRPGNTGSIRLFKELEIIMETELIFYMLIRQFRLMIYSLDSKFPVEEARSMQPWLKSKLLKQASYFGEEKLLKNYKNFYEIDYQTKFGLTPFNLSTSIDITLSSL